MVSSQGKWIEPELAGGTIPLHMDVLRLVAVEAVEEEPVRSSDVGDLGITRPVPISLLFPNRIIHHTAAPRAPTMADWDRHASPNIAGYGSGARFGAPLAQASGVTSRAEHESRHPAGP